MKKIPTLFVRPEGGKLVIPEVREGCEWVLAGEGIATLKWDGSCCAVRNGVLYRRYIAKVAPSPEEAATVGFVPVNDDGKEGHRHGWIPVGNSPNDQYHREAWANRGNYVLDQDWTYELVGPKVQGNPYGLEKHVLYPHGLCPVNAPHTFDELKDWLMEYHHEGVVWWRDVRSPDSDKVKIKRRDFGLPWPIKRGK